LYGIIIGRVLFGESMFSDVPNASKIALLLLDRMLQTETLGLIDCQVQSRHLLSLGASVIPRAQFSDCLDEMCEPPSAFDGWPDAPIRASQLVRD
jgi:leucyl/phenylalanyl-tRNA--protein transferase